MTDTNAPCCMAAAHGQACTCRTRDLTPEDRGKAASYRARQMLAELPPGALDVLKLKGMA